MAANPATEQHLMESRERVVEVGETASYQRVLLVGNDPALLVVRDERGRCIARIEGNTLDRLTFLLSADVMARIKKVIDVNREPAAADGDDPSWDRGWDAAMQEIASVLEDYE